MPADRSSTRAFGFQQKLRVTRDFVAYGFEVVKVYCIYPIQMRTGDVVEAGFFQKAWGFSFRVMADDPEAFVRERVPEKDQWVAHLTLGKSGVWGLLDEEGTAMRDQPALKAEDVFEPIAAEGPDSLGTANQKSSHPDIGLT